MSFLDSSNKCVKVNEKEQKYIFRNLGNLDIGSREKFELNWIVEKTNDPLNGSDRIHVFVEKLKSLL